MKIEMRAEPSYEDMLVIASNLRERDRQEIFATRYGENPADLAADVVRTGAFRWAFYIDGRPVAAIGAFPRWPNVWSVWAFGTDEWDKVVLAITRHARRFMYPAMFRSGATRVDCMVLATHRDARAWLEYLGLRPEKVMDNWGKKGEGFVCYCWTRHQTQGSHR